MSHEEFLKQCLCPNCHTAIMEPHSEIELNNQGYFKCPICAFSKQINERKRKSDIIKQ